MTIVYCLACSIVAFGLGVGLANKVRGGLSALYQKAKADAITSVVNAELKANMTKKV